MSTVAIAAEGTDEPFESFAERIPLFAGLDAQALREVHFIAEPFTAPAGQRLFRQGDAANGLYLLRNGEVTISRRLPGDEDVNLVTLGAGDLIGEMGLLDAGSRSATAAVSRDCSGYFMSRERFATLRATRSTAAFAILNRFLDELCRRTASLLREVNATVSAQPTLAPLAPRATTDTAGTAPPPVEAKLPAQRILARLPLFGTFTPDELQQFTAPLTLHAFAKGHVLFRTGEPAQGCYVVVRGALSLFVRCANGERQLQIAVLGPGQTAGQIGLIHAGTHLLQCAARESSLVLHISPQRFAQMRTDGGAVASRFFDALTASTVQLLRKANGHVARLRPERHATLAADMIAAPPTIQSEGA